MNFIFSFIFLEVPSVLGLHFTFFLNSCKYNCLVQDYGRALYTISKGFLDVGRPPLRFYEHLFFSFFFLLHHSVYIPDFVLRFGLPRLEYRSEF